ncbi:hypothetical protein EON67_08075 [archaeon]|nr:MAG: hypothetical protein EON67_08075 [archaeon]
MRTRTLGSFCDQVFARVRVHTHALARTHACSYLSLPCRRRRKRRPRRPSTPTATLTKCTHARARARCCCATGLGVRVDACVRAHTAPHCPPASLLYRNPLGAAMYAAHFSPLCCVVCTHMSI